MAQSLRLDRRTLLGGLALGAALPAFAQGAPSALRIKPDRELMVPVEGGSIYVRVNGDPSGPRAPFIGIHGGPGSGHAGLLPFTAMADERAVILYDQLDSGQSDAPNDPANWRVPRFVDELDRIRDALGIKHWHVAGGSWGGTIALEYGARRRPEMASLIIQSPLISSPRWMADARVLRSELPPQWQATLTACERPSPPPASECEAGVREYYRRHVSGGSGLKDIADYRASRPRRAGRQVYVGMWGDNEFSASGSLKDYDGEPLLKKLDGPRTLFVAGEFDEARPQTVAAYAGRVPGATFREIKGSRHAILADAPNDYLALVRTWCAKHEIKS